MTAATVTSLRAEVGFAPQQHGGRATGAAIETAYEFISDGRAASLYAEVGYRPPVLNRGAACYLEVIRSAAIAVPRRPPSLSINRRLVA